MNRYLLIPHIKIHNANALSSPYTIGFPAMTAWLGAVHALQRHLNQSDNPDIQNIQLPKVAISCHSLNLQTHQTGFVSSIIGTANPLDRDGSRPAFIEEARCHLDVSLLIEVKHFKSPRNESIELFIQAVTDILQGKMKMASGDILSFQPVQYHSIDPNEKTQCRTLINKLMLGHVLIERREIMEMVMEEDEKDALTALIDFLKVEYRAEPLENQDIENQEKIKASWTMGRSANGWLVPIAVGFQGISELGNATNQRDNNTKHRFAEAIVTLGEFIMPYRIDDLDEIMWQYHFDSTKNLYLCQNQYN